MALEDIENIESEAAKVHEEEKVTDQKLEVINKTLDRLSMDAAVLASVAQVREDEYEREKYYKREKEKLSERLSRIIDEVNAHSQDLKNEAAVLQELENSGIEISGGYDVLRERQEYLSETMERVVHVSQQFDLSVSIQQTLVMIEGGGGESQENTDRQLRDRAMSYKTGRVARGDFCGFDVSQYQEGGDYFVEGKYHNLYMDYYQSYGDYEIETVDREHQSIELVDLDLVEGIHLSERDVQDAQVFWTQHDHSDGASMASFMEIASHIPEVKRELAKGRSLESIDQDPILGQCAALYFHPEYANAPTLVKGDGYYEWNSNGRHRILAARALGYTFPMRIEGFIRHK